MNLVNARFFQTILAMLLAIPVLALAQTPIPATPKVDQRQAKQGARIQQGVESGQLTGKEAVKLEKGQARVERIEEKAKADGKLTQKERARLRDMQDRQSDAIYKEKHDRQTDRNHDGKKDRRSKKERQQQRPQ